MSMSYNVYVTKTSDEKQTLAVQTISEYLHQGDNTLTIPQLNIGLTPRSNFYNVGSLVINGVNQNCSLLDYTVTGDTIIDFTAGTNKETQTSANVYLNLDTENSNNLNKRLNSDEFYFSIGETIYEGCVNVQINDHYNNFQGGGGWVISYGGELYNTNKTHRISFDGTEYSVETLSSSAGYNTFGSSTIPDWVLWLWNQVQNGVTSVPITVEMFDPE